VKISLTILVYVIFNIDGPIRFVFDSLQKLVEY
jgi:hypothetical protein